jgi:hypothetical protein
MNKKKFRKWYWIFSILSWISLLTPLAVWIGINFDKYVVQKSGFSVTVGGVLAVLSVVLLLKYGIKKFGKVFWMSILLVIIYCLDTIIVDALPITFFTWLGTLLFSILEKPAQYFKEKYNVYVNEEIRVDARNSATTTTSSTTEKRLINVNGRC